MDKQRLLEVLREIADRDDADAERWHIDADKALLEYIDDEEVSEAHGAVALYCG